MTLGTVLPKVRARLIELLADRPALEGVSVSYAVPTGVEQVGRAEVIFFDLSEATGDIENLAICQPPLQLKETWTQTIVVEVGALDDSWTAEVIDTRASELLGEVLDQLCEDPHLAMPVSEWGVITVLPDSWRIASELLINGGYGTRIELALQITADRS